MGEGEWGIKDAQKGEEQKNAMKHGEKRKVGQSLNNGWKESGMETRQEVTIFFTLALLPNRFKQAFPLDENVSMSKRVDNKTRSNSKKSKKT